MTGRRLAIVVQRYGSDVAGGSEQLARALAEHLAAQDSVTVFTTCARDYVTWRNEHAEGSETLSGVEVRRFGVEAERDLDAFNAFAEPLYQRASSRAEELEFLRRQGPVCPSLVDQLAADKDRFDAILFFTYLYYPTYHGLRVAPQRSILVPTTHDEPPLRFSIYREVFGAARGFVFLTPAEEALVRSRFDVGERPAAVAAMGVDVPESPDVSAFRARHGLLGRYVLYAGRIDAGKGCAEMLRFYDLYRNAMPSPAHLVLIGKLAMPEPASPGVRYLGYLPEAEKHAAMAGASALLCPSPFESLSIVLLEAMALGTPALASARSAVLLEHCRRSNAGLWYEDEAEFAAVLDRLVRDEPLRRALGANGRRYVAEDYRWDVVLGRYRALIDAVRGG